MWFLKNSEECLTLGKRVAGTHLLLDKRLLPLSQLIVTINNTCRASRSICDNHKNTWIIDPTRLYGTTVIGKEREGEGGREREGGSKNMNKRLKCERERERGREVLDLVT
ncbi:hypothetical protein DPMN_116841 [Dreissena polymorpha]|uniref:Uncharacterized protein n=1 Tax=Dreissena polymorpha TaxID=45954 RepID=A0A9D4KQ65_DREPO|nr:hypothetical protein DPMN_116841 [Dreissena polymorpha]